MRTTATRRVEVSVSKGGTETIDATFRAGRGPDAQAMYDLSTPFAQDGFLLARDWDLFHDGAEDFFVVEADRTIIACAGVRRFDDCAEIFNVAVDARWQGWGIGRVLLAGILGALHDEGCGRAFVFSKTTAAWFAGYGFRPADLDALPPERLATIDPDRCSTPMTRPTLPTTNRLDSMPHFGDVAVRFARSDVQLPWTESAESLLSFAQDNGIDVQSLCWGGVCGTCSTGVRRGTVSYQVDPEIDPPDGEVLLCIARPMTGLVLDL